MKNSSQDQMCIGGIALDPRHILGAHPSKHIGENNNQNKRELKKLC